MSVPSLDTTTPAVLSIAWRDWIRTNLARGCTVESIVDQMIGTGFAEKEALRHVQDVQAARPTTAPTTTYTPRPSTLPDLPVIDIEGHRIQVMARWKRPLVTVLDNVLTPEECEALMALSRDRLARSTVVDDDSGGRSVIRARTSDGTWWPRESEGLVATIDHRLVKLTGIPLSQAEGLQVMRYGVGGEYKPHFDYFPPQRKGSAVHMAQGGQRIATMLMYLQAPEAGGATSFPEAGISVIPKQGSAVYFEYMDVHGNIDPLTLHAGDPVVRGEKWIATRWIRERAF